MALLNDNFDKTIQDISDIGARFTSTGGFNVTIPAGSFLPPYTISLVDSSPRFVPGKLQVVPRFEIYEDNDNNSAYLVGFTNSQSKKAIISMWIQRVPVAGSLADVVISIQNTDAVSHVYFVHFDESYQDSPRTGVFR